ncbi:unnamed protein product [Bursaphelenchus okinawaensis]|uniref:Uncharacterized protein n=1 Tax=Bursaphelenchus okinawaensis TaxID=465554 RepID=A0A811L1G2_9BILA|nr:unnamed protein product [Bursaphelenchus okinawaensis]CAG9116970.1 unnamed protein product [Bursaphelenchus okinawaensis]
MAELFYHNDDKNPLPWAEYEAHFRLRQMMKTTLLPANLIYRNMPNEFYRINAYLHTLDRVDAPDYRYIILDLLRAKQKYIILRNRALNKLEDANEYTNEKTSKLDPLCPTVESNELLERYYDEIEGIFDNEFGDPDLDLN